MIHDPPNLLLVGCDVTVQKVAKQRQTMIYDMMLDFGSISEWLCGKECDGDLKFFVFLNTMQKLHTFILFALKNDLAVYQFYAHQVLE